MVIYEQGAVSNPKFIGQSIKTYYEKKRIVYIIEPSIDGYYGFRKELTFNSDEEALEYSKQYSKEVGCEMVVTKDIITGKVIGYVRGWKED